MNESSFALLKNHLPRNFILKNPLKGSLILYFFFFGFTLIYRPLGTHPGRFFGYELTMAFYSLFAAMAAFGIMTLLNRSSRLSGETSWNILKELAAVLITLLTMGLAVYSAGFLMEEPGGRLNFSTLLNSLLNVALAGFIPFLFFILMNHRLWLPGNEVRIPEAPAATRGPSKINIISQLKKEELSFYPDELIYAESDGNYVHFYLLTENKVQKKMIRNSINQIEEQLAEYPRIFRTHRAFLVNLDKIRMRKGNSLGYRLKMVGTDEEIPVSRNNTRKFIQLLNGTR
jgi:hypothetical protein